MNSGLRSATPMPLRSPCVEVCKMDPATQLCLGCCRTREERDWWVAYSDAQQRDVRRRCEQRKLCGPFVTKLLLDSCHQFLGGYRLRDDSMLAGFCFLALDQQCG